MGNVTSRLIIERVISKDISIGLMFGYVQGIKLKNSDCYALESCVKYENKVDYLFENSVLLTFEKTNMKNTLGYKLLTPEFVRIGYLKTYKTINQDTSISFDYIATLFDNE
jgi:hypothetical protein